MRGKQLTQNFFEYSIGLFQRLIVPEPNYPKTFRFKIRCSLCIASSPLGVLPAIEFYYQLLLKADKISDVRWNRMLSPKLEPAQIAVFQLQPEPQFRVGR